MECTQRLECTQELYDTHTERVCPEQIGFLGICGAKHPVLRGPNKIGRDPQTCSIVLNLNSVSRQHAVINVLSSKEYMLMDLDSANKTKLLNKTLQPYIPHPIRNGDTVQFGDIFGIFRLLEEDDDLPMTQALDIPETPVPTKHVSKLAKVPTTMIPESPDVSDRDDSFATPQQVNTETTRLSSGQFIKPFGKTISIQPISSPKTDASRNSSKKTITFVDNVDTSLNESLISLKADKKADNIHEMDTQAPYPIDKPSVNESTDSIYTADTQIPPGYGGSPSIHSLDTQIPTTEHLPQVRKIDNQQEMQFDIYAANKENDLSIFNAETQPFVCEKDQSIDSNNKPQDIAPKSANQSEEDLLFDEIVDDCFEEFNSQPLLPQESPELGIKPKTNAIIESDNSTDCEDIIPTQKIKELPVKKQTGKAEEKVKPSKRNNRVESDVSTDCEDIDFMPTQKIPELPIVKGNATEKKFDEIDATQKIEELPIKTQTPENVKPSKRNNRIKSDESTDCEDIEFMPTQKIPEIPIDNNNAKEKKIHRSDAAKRVNRIRSDSSTDCEDVDIMPTQKIPTKNIDKDDDLTDCEDELVEIILPTKSNIKVTKFEDMPTQVIDVDQNKIEKPAFEDMDTQIIGLNENFAATSNKDNSFEDQPTQIIDEIILNNPEPAKKAIDEIVSPFKIPLQSPLRVKSKEIPKITPKGKNIDSKSIINDDNYYNATQDIIDDLSSQREGSPILKAAVKSTSSSSSPIIIEDDVVPCSVEGYKVGEKFANIDKELSPAINYKDQSATKYAASLSSQEIRNVIGVESSVDKLKKFPSDSSDIESTPKKVRSLIFTDSDLPNSQEIKSNMFINHTKSYATESSSESEQEENTEDQCTPFLHRKKKSKPVAKIDLTKRFDTEKLPERIITRVRKPTAKMEENLQMDKKTGKNILKPTFLTEQEDQIDQEIITENMKRLKTYVKAKTSKEAKNESKSKSEKDEPKVDKNDTERGKQEIKADKNVIKINDDKSKSKENKNVDTIENKSLVNTNEVMTRAKAENKSRVTKEKIKVKIEKPKKKETDKEQSNKKDVSSRKSKEESNVNKSKERISVTRNKEDTRQSEKDSNKSKEDSLLSISDGRNSTRSTRTRRKRNEHKTAEKESISPESKEPVENKRRRPTRIKEQPKESVSPEVEIRRSKRQIKVKEDKKSDSQTMQAPKSILKKSVHEQSTVYNMSTSGGESPKNLKRSLGDDSEVPSPKRTRAYVNNVNSINNTSLRATPARIMKTQHVLFTAFPSEEVKQKLEKLGAVIVSDVMQCTVVLTMQVKRTFKLLCAVGLGRPIVGPSWVQACVDTHMIVDPWLYLIKDDSAEKRFQFSLERTLNSKRNFLNGYNVSSTPSVQPNAAEMKLIVECSGGTWQEGGSNWVCVSSTKDKALWPALRKRGAIIVSTEFILGGVLRQKIEIIANKFL